MSTILRILSRAISLSLIGMLPAVSTVWSGAHAAQPAWKPQKNVELVVGAQPGGANDRMGRMLQKILTADNTASMSMTVMNKPGQGQSLGVVYVNSHPGDPHYLLILGSSWVTTAITTGSTSTHRDLTPIMKVVDTDLVVFVPVDSPLRSIKDLVDGLKKGTSSYSFGFSTSAGNASHIALAQLARFADFDPRKLRMVVNASGSITATQVAGGHISIGVSSSGSAHAMVSTGKARLIGAIASQRLPQLPNLPTLREQGYDVVVPTWFAVFGPKGVAPAQVAFWEDAIGKAVRQPEAKQFFDANNWTIDLIGASELPSQLDREYGRLRAMLSDLGMVK
ncbi:MAG: tripartite tricarboxylate transporter substrate binding protein [Betaproteobacteria bacterium]|nr:tripartite tricarboxylate transporter substrate binding protein [Betaproteobacteria bacterium]